MLKAMGGIELFQQIGFGKKFRVIAVNDAVAVEKGKISVVDPHEAASGAGIGLVIGFFVCHL